MFIIGLDASMNGSGLVKLELNEKFEIISKDYLSFTTSKKLSGRKIFHYRKKDFTDNFNQFRWMLAEILNFIPPKSYVAIEGYAMGARGGAIFDIGEWGGILKYHILQKECTLRIYPPKTIKKWFSGNGNADKIMMFNAYDELNDPLGIGWLDKHKSPQNDIIDAYAIADMFYHEIINSEKLQAFKNDKLNKASKEVLESPTLYFTDYD